MLLFGLANGKPVRELSKLKIMENVPDAANCFTSNLKSIVFKYFHSFKPKISKFHQNIISCLKELSRDKSLIIAQPDKGNGVVLLNKHDYIEKMLEIVNDPVNFSRVSDELYPLLVKHQDRNNRIVDQLKKQGIIDETTCRNLKSTGACPGILYGQPKVHKKGIPMRPIISTIGTFNYNVSRWLVPKLAPLTTNSFTVKNSLTFA